MTDEKKEIEEQEVVTSSEGDVVVEAGTLGDKTAARSDRIIQVIAIILLALILIGALGFPAAASTVIFALADNMTHFFHWWFVLGAAACFILCLYVMCSKLGVIRLGGPDARPQYSYFSWFAMLYATGQGVGMIFWGIAEPIFMVEGNPLVTNSIIGGNLQAASGLAWTWFHWGIPAWAIYCTTALVLAYSRFNRRKNASFRDAMEEILPKNPAAKQILGILIELIVILTTVCGLCTSAGTGAQQFNTGIKTLINGSWGGSMDITVTVGAIVLFGVIASLSVFLGVSRGVRNISNVNAWASFILVGGVLILGPTIYILSTMVQGIGVFFDTFIQMLTYTQADLLFESASGQYTGTFQGSWNVFIWSWTFAFSTFTGQFVATISRGRTLREFVAGVMIVPTIIVVVWSGVLGGAALYFDQLTTAGGYSAWDPMAVLGTFTAGDVLTATNESSTNGLFVTLMNVPGGKFFILVAVFLIASYLVSSLDSSVLALSDFVATATKPSRIFKVVLCLIITALAASLFLMGGSDAMTTVQTGCLVGALPFTVVLLFAVINFVRLAKQDPMLPGHEEELAKALEEGFYDMDASAVGRHA